jgi:hypothetical protein
MKRLLLVFGALGVIGSAAHAQGVSGGCSLVSTCRSTVSPAASTSVAGPNYQTTVPYPSGSLSGAIVSGLTHRLDVTGTGVNSTGH